MAEFQNPQVQRPAPAADAELSLSDIAPPKLAAAQKTTQRDIVELRAQGVNGEREGVRGTENDPQLKHVQAKQREFSDETNFFSSVVSAPSVKKRTLMLEQKVEELRSRFASDDNLALQQMQRMKDALDGLTPASLTGRRSMLLRSVAFSEQGARLAQSAAELGPGMQASRRDGFTAAEDKYISALKALTA